jgi:hypothetical protein
MAVGGQHCKQYLCCPVANAESVGQLGDIRGAFVEGFKQTDFVGNKQRKAMIA